MGRRIWVIPNKDQIKDTDLADAVLNNCPEIANGIPPSLIGIIKALPCAYEETEPPPSEPPRDFATEIDSLKTRVEKLEKK